MTPGSPQPKLGPAMRSRPSSPTLLRNLALLAMLVLGLGVPRYFVLCHEDDGRVQVAFAHHEADCFADLRAAIRAALPLAEGAPTEDGLPSVEATPCCEHHTFGVGSPDRPRPTASDVPPHQLALRLPLVAWVPATAARPSLRPRATGPPDPPPTVAQLRQLASVRLLV